MAKYDVPRFLSLCIASYIGQSLGRYICKQLFPKDEQALTIEVIKQHYEVIKQSYEELSHLRSEMHRLLEEIQLQRRELEALKEENEHS